MKCGFPDCKEDLGEYEGTSVGWKKVCYKHHEWLLSIKNLLEDL